LAQSSCLCAVWGMQRVYALCFVLWAVLFCNSIRGGTHNRGIHMRVHDRAPKTLRDGALCLIYRTGSGCGVASAIIFASMASKHATCLRCGRARACDGDRTGHSAGGLRWVAGRSSSKIRAPGHAAETSAGANASRQQGGKLALAARRVGAEGGRKWMCWEFDCTGQGRPEKARGHLCIALGDGLAACLLVANVIRIDVDT
jgi:hypothetical protein